MLLYLVYIIYLIALYIMKIVTKGGYLLPMNSEEISRKIVDIFKKFNMS
jgi:hypothetical protein